MGLDMYLEAEQYVSEYNERDLPFAEAIKRTVPNGLSKFRPSNVTFELAYWRKSNAVHRWFVDNIQDGKDECQRSYVASEKLEELRDICQKILDNNQLACDLLPTAKGFFFGSQEYDEYYFRDIERTYDMLDRIVKNPESKNWSIYYQASW